MDFNLNYESNCDLYFQPSLFYEDMRNKTSELLRKKIVETFQRVDEEIRNSKERKIEGWIIKDTRLRKLKTIYGIIEFKRTRFYNKYTKEVKSLADISLGIERYQKICSYLKNMILTKVGTGNRYRDIVDIYEESTISEMDISNIVKKMKINNGTLEDLKFNKIDVSNKKYIYIETDDTFINMVKDGVKTNFRIRLFVVHTGTKKGMYKRNIIENKIVGYQVVKISNPISTTSSIKKINKMIKENYENYDKCKFIVMGDAARWISSLADEINASFVLDKFHYIKKLREVFRSGKFSRTDRNLSRLFAETKSVIENGPSIVNIFEKLDKVLLYLEDNEYKVQIEKLYEFIKFTNRNSKGIENYYKQFSSNSHTEGLVSWFVKHVLGYGKKIYSFKVFMNILELKKYKNNGYDLSELLEYQEIEKQDNQIFKAYNEIAGYNSIGYLNRYNKNSSKISNGQITRKTIGFVHTRKK